MHVLITADTLGGVWIYTKELVSGLLRRGHHVTLVSLGRVPTGDQSRWMDGLGGLDFLATRYRLEWMQNCEQDIAESREFLSNLALQLRPDILHLNQYCYGNLECDTPRIVVAHSDVLNWWRAVHQDLPIDNPWLSWYQDTVCAGLRAADVVVAPSEWMMQSLSSYYSQPEMRRVIYNGRNCAIFRVEAQKNLCVLTVGRIWDEAKQASLLLERNHPVPVWIVGPHRLPENDTHNSIASLPGSYHLCGERSEEEMCLLFAQSAIYAATSRYEPFGLAPVEAALSGCALVANDIPVFHELWGDNVRYFRRNDPDSLAFEIRELLGNKRLTCRYADRAREHAAHRFDATRMIDEYEQLYRNILQCEAEA